MKVYRSSTIHMEMFPSDYNLLLKALVFVIVSDGRDYKVNPDFDMDEVKELHHKLSNMIDNQPVIMT
jgi:hypothetical protein